MTSKPPPSDRPRMRSRHPNPVSSGAICCATSASAVSRPGSAVLPIWAASSAAACGRVAQDGGPVKIGFIEDESGNLAVYGLQKLHAAQLAVKEINEGKTLKGAPNIGAGMLGVLGKVATKPPVISKEGTALDVVNDGGAAGQGGPGVRRGRRHPDRFRRPGDARAPGRAGVGRRPEQQRHLAAARPPHDPAGQCRRAGRGLRQRRARSDPPDRRSVQAALLLHQPVRRRRRRRQHVLHRTGMRAAGDPDRAVHGRALRAEVLHDRRRLQFRPAHGGVDQCLHPAGRWRDHGRGVHPALGLRVQPGDRPHPADQSRTG